MQKLKKLKEEVQGAISALGEDISKVEHEIRKTEEYHSSLVADLGNLRLALMRENGRMDAIKEIEGED